jgi:hypothetical protein
LARRLAAVYEALVTHYKYSEGLSPAEAVAKADEQCSLSRLFEIMDRQPERITWEDVRQLVGETGTRAADCWQEIVQAAREELGSGHRAGGALMDRYAVPYQLARFLAIREELTEGWQPRNGVERQLIDQMAQAQSAAYFWLERLTNHPGLGGPFEQLGAMVDRFNRVFLRLLRALQDLRRRSSAHERPSRRAGACRQATSNHVQSRFARLN